MSIALDRIATALDRAGATTTRLDGQQLRSTCPGHGGDTVGTLSVRQLGDRARVHCFKGCADIDVLKAIGLEVRDLFDSPRGSTYTYRDADGTNLFANRRYVKHDGTRGFYNDKSRDAPNVLYNLPDVIRAVADGHTIYVVEGEADAEAARSVGAVATTSGGRNTAQRADWTPLHGAKSIVVVHDDDEAGRAYAADVLAALTGKVEQLEVRRPAAGNDLSDHLTRGHDLDALVPVDLDTLPSTASSAVQRPVRLVLTPAASVRTRRQQWLWADRIPMDTPSIFAGRGGEGKTTFALDLIAQLTLGTLPGEHHGTPASVLIWSGEDRPETVLLPRLNAAGADLERVHLITGVERDEGTDTTPSFPADVAALETAITSTGAVVAMLDPLTSTTGGDLHKVADVRRTLDALAEVTHRTGAVVLGIMHFNKGQGHAGDKLSGSHAFRDAVRSLFLFARDDESGHRIVTQEKNNYAEEVAASLAYDLVSTEVATDDGETVHVARVVHLGESDVSVQDLIDRTREDPEQRQERGEAEAFLIDYLKGTEAFEAPAADVLKAARASGFSDQQVKDARRRAKSPRVTSRKGAFGGGWVWALDLDADEYQGGDQHPEGGEGGKVASPRESATIGATIDQGGQGSNTPQGSATLPPSPPSTDSAPPSPAAPALLAAYRRAGGDNGSVTLDEAVNQ